MRCSIARTLIGRLVAEAAATPTIEVCGLLFGRDGAIEDAVGTGNVATEPWHRFEIDPAVLFAAIRAERSGGPRILGYYHSHPTGDARPSPRDAVMVDSFDRLWLIIAGTDVRLWTARCGGIVHGAFDEVTIECA